MDPLKTGQPAPGFSLPDLDGRIHTLADVHDRITVLNFWSADCPQSARADAELLAYLDTWGERVTLLTIASNANEPQALLLEVAKERGLPLLLQDPIQQVADLYGAVTTPHLFVIDPAGILRYEGALDNVTFRQRTPTQRYLHQAVEALLAGTVPEIAQTPVYGCMIVRQSP